MSRLLAPDDKCAQVDVPIGRGLRYTGKTIDVSDPSHVRALKAVGYTSADVSGTPVRAHGYRCAGCGFNAWFKTCGRCGAACERPE